MTASGHESDGEGPGDRNQSTQPPDEQGNAHADNATGSGPKNATSHAESGHPKNKGGQTETGSGPKTATERNVRKVSSFRSRPETKLTRHGDPIAKTPTKTRKVEVESTLRSRIETGPITKTGRGTRGREPEGTPTQDTRGRANGRSRGRPPESTNWRGRTTNRHSQS